MSTKAILKRQNNRKKLQLKKEFSTINTNLEEPNEQVHFLQYAAMIFRTVSQKKMKINLKAN